ncbi:MAG: hypothetical protein IPK03_05535 [Bacteroidetes bacterium]|nr:hypothetical protein [Bacteroidota bacterium]
MPKFTIIQSSSIQKDVQKEQRNYFLENLEVGSFDLGNSSVFIDKEPSHPIMVFAGEGILEGKKLYLGRDKG